MLTLAVDMPPVLKWAPLIPSLPFIGMLICGLAGALRRPMFRNLTSWITVAVIATGFVLTMAMLRPMLAAAHEGHESSGFIVHFFHWVRIGDFKADFSFFIDPLTVVMLTVVTGVGTLIATYAAWYME